MNTESFAYFIVLRREDGATYSADKPQWSHSAWSAGAQYIRKHKNAKIVSIARLQQG